MHMHGANLHAEQHNGHGSNTYIWSKCDAGISGGFAGDEKEQCDYTTHDEAECQALHYVLSTEVAEEHGDHCGKANIAGTDTAF
jgi:hypothetical protein